MRVDGALFKFGLRNFFVYNFEGPFDVFSKAISLIFEVVGMYVCVCRAI